jgi:tRNA nucleotidyltransferase (CCA-adding enzyme)
MCHTPGGGVPISDSAVRRLLRRLDNAGGGPTIKQWAQLVEADKAGRGEGARHSRNYLPDWLAIADRIGNEKAVGKAMLKGQHIAEAGVPRGPMWAIIVAQSEEAQDEGAFTDEDGAREWLAANRDPIMKETARRLQEAQAASEKKKAALAIALKARQEEQRAAARAAKAATQAAARI